MTVHTSIRPYVCMSVHPYAKPNTLKNKSSTITIGISLILDIHIRLNWQLSNQGICWPVSCDHITGSGLVLIEVTFFEVDRWPGTGFRLDRRLKSGYFSGGDGGSKCKDKILVQINPWLIVDFSSDMFLAELSLGKSLIYCIRNFYNLGYTYWV